MTQQDAGDEGRTAQHPVSYGSTSTSRRRRQLRFLAVGGLCYVITIGINFLLKWTVLESKPTTALLIATTIASIVSYSLNKRWTFSSRGSNHPGMEAFLFAVVTGIGIVINSVPLYVSRYVLGFEHPAYSLLFQEVADFVSGPILGTALAMVFRWVAMDLIVFVERKADATSPEGD